MRVNSHCERPNGSSSARRLPQGPAGNFNGCARPSISSASGMAANNPTIDRLAMALTENGAAAAVRIIFQLSADHELLDAHQLTDGRIGNPIADLLVAEIQRRELEV